MVVYLAFFTLWVFLIDNRVSKYDTAIAIVLLILNSINFAREIWQSNFGRHLGYFSSGWNQIDLASIAGVYAYSVLFATSKGNASDHVPLAVITTLLLTMKLISYLRAFNETGKCCL
mmetsp:Transcript_28543/g.53678  ORF Transcript_28543/g.53678 Transcript_28543/m.53678 type:complete len:117 (+) Transcript_28543:146-496(+)